jgi:hypothetical protein
MSACDRQEACVSRLDALIRAVIPGREANPE